MKKRFSTAAVLSLCAVAIVITYIFTASAAKNHYDAQLDKAYEDLAPFTKLLEINKYVTENYVGEIDEDALMEGVFDGYFAGLGDRFSMYHNKAEMDQLNMTADGKLVGIGVLASYDVDTPGIYIRRVMPDSPAEAAGIRENDVVTAVNGTVVTEETYGDCINAVRGEAGTSVTLTVLSGGKTTDVNVTRATVRSRNVFMNWLEGDIAFIQITEFSGNVATDFVSCMKEAETKGAKGYVFDMRGNPGGDLEIICTVLDYLLPEGPIIRVKNAAGNIVFTRDSGASCVNAPMTVLVDGNTASAAELFTAALRDYHKATIIGTTTFGKGTMQHIITLSDGSGIRLSCYYYDPPYGENYHGKGITPDIVLDQSDYYKLRPYLLNEENDIQIQAAKKELLKIIEGVN
jgi:peptidase, S41 family